MNKAKPETGTHLKVKMKREFKTDLNSKSKTIAIMDQFDGVGSDIKYLRMVLNEQLKIKVGRDTVAVSFVVERKDKKKTAGMLSITDLKQMNADGSNAKNGAVKAFVEDIKEQITKEVAKKYCETEKIFRFQKCYELLAKNSVKRCGGETEETEKKYIITGAYLDYSGVHYEMSAGYAKRNLVMGNRQYVNSLKYETSVSRRTLKKFTEGQNPYAIIVTCSDSRVIPELIFSAGLGELFVIRVAGNVIDSHQLGSIEYAAEHLSASLVVVLGHTGCGAINAVLGGHSSGYIKYIADKIEEAIGEEKDPYQACCLNVEHSCDIIRNSLDIQTYEEEHGFKVMGAVYDIATGEVKFL